MAIALCVRYLTLVTFFLFTRQSHMSHVCHAATLQFRFWRTKSAAHESTLLSKSIDDCARISADMFLFFAGISRILPSAISLQTARLFNQAATAPLPLGAARLGICGHVELQRVRVVGDRAIEFAQRVVTGTHQVITRKTLQKDKQRAGNSRGSTIKISVCVAAVELDDAREVTDRALKLHPKFD